MAKTELYTVEDPRGVEYTLRLTEKSAKQRGAKKVTKRGGRAADNKSSDSKS